MTLPACRKHVKPAFEQADDMKAKMDMIGQFVTDFVTNFGPDFVTKWQKWRFWGFPKSGNKKEQKVETQRVQKSPNSLRMRSFSYPYPLV